MDIFERHHRGYVITTDPARVDFDVVHHYLSEQSYWARGRRADTTRRAIESSLMFSACAHDGQMVGSLRVVTDCATFGWICDLFVLAEHRGVGLGKQLVGAAREHPCLADAKRVLLATADAHDLYAGFDFRPLAEPEMWMEFRGGTA